MSQKLCQVFNFVRQMICQLFNYFSKENIFPFWNFSIWKLKPYKHKGFDVVFNGERGINQISIELV